MLDRGLARLDAIGQAEACQRGDVSPRELFLACLDRIAAIDPLLGAVVDVVHEPPVAEDGPLAGVPFLAKDVLPWPGLRWSMGSRALRGQRASVHVPLGMRLVEAGLVCVGKTAMSELGLLASTEPLLDGATKSPWDLARSPGGSSGGSAAAVAAGIVPIAHASDGGGSIRVPAALTGVFGFLPTRGRSVAASFGSSAFLEMTGDHCLSRSVRDSALFLSITEDTSVRAPVGFVRDPIRPRLRVGTWTTGAFGVEPAPEIARAHDDVVALLAALGHDVRRAPPPVFAPALGDAFFVVAGAAAAGLVELLEARSRSPLPTDRLEAFTWALVERFRAAGPRALEVARAALAEAGRTYRDAIAAYDVVLTPVASGPAWPIGHLSPELPTDVLFERTSHLLAYTPLANAAGVPAMSVPLSFPEGGCPIGSHFAARAGDDALLFGLAYELERARPWAHHWPPCSVEKLA